MSKYWLGIDTGYRFPHPENYPRTAMHVLLPLSTGRHSAVRDAVVEYARHHARLPLFPPRRQLSSASALNQEEATVIEPGVVRLVACGRVQGEVLARSEDVWLALMPFNDFTSSTLDAYKRVVLQGRVRLMHLLARLASSPSFLLDPAIDCVYKNAECSRNNFWLELLRALDPDACQDTMKDLERNLVVLSRGSKLRFLIRIETDPSQGGFIQSLEYFFEALAELELPESDASLVNAIHLSGLSKQSHVHPFEIGFQFTHGKMTKAVMSKLLDCIVNISISAPYRVSCLRFGADCTIQTTAVEVLGDQLDQIGIDTLQLGSVNEIRPASLRRCLSSAAVSIRRLITTDRDDSIEAAASMIRYAAPPSSLRLSELDVLCTSSVDLAAWLAYGLFHVDSKSPISSLCIRMHPDAKWLTTEWINTFKRVLMKVTPEEDLADMEVDDGDNTQVVTQRLFVKLKPSTTIKSQPYSGVKALYKTLSDDTDIEFEKIASANKYIAVIIPCVGVGWAPEASVVEERAQGSLAGGELKTNGRITSLTWVGQLSSMMSRDASYYQHTEVLLEFLSIVGKPLTSLSLPDMNLSTDDLHRILQYCPNLAALNISDNNDCDIAPLVEAVELGKFQLTSLSIQRKNCCTDETPLLQQMTRIVSHQSGPESTLRQISMHMLPPRQPNASFFDDQVLPLVLVFNAAHHIDFIQLRGHHMCSHADPQHRLVSLDVAGSGDDFTKLALRSKLAFLSVIQESSQTELDASVLSLIFQFSRSPVARHALLVRPNEFGQV